MYHTSNMFIFGWCFSCCYRPSAKRDKTYRRICPHISPKKWLGKVIEIFLQKCPVHQLYTSMARVVVEISQENRYDSSYGICNTSDQYILLFGACTVIVAHERSSMLLFQLCQYYIPVDQLISP